eukprot:4777205-Pleurochrysis_carterae.AAC.4
MPASLSLECSQSSVQCMAVQAQDHSLPIIWHEHPVRGVTWYEGDHPRVSAAANSMPTLLRGGLLNIWDRALRAQKSNNLQRTI